MTDTDFRRTKLTPDPEAETIRIDIGGESLVLSFTEAVFVGAELQRTAKQHGTHFETVDRPAWAQRTSG
jgi:hypothetical protein